MDIKFTAVTMEDLLFEYQKKVASAQLEITDRITKAQLEGDFASIQKITLEMQADMEKLALGYQDYLEQLSGVKNEELSIYDAEICSLDLDLTVYDGDRDYLAEFLKDPDIQTAYNEMKDNNPVVQSRRNLLKSSLRLTRTLAPALYAIGDRCSNKLGLNREIEFYIYQGESFNAACYPPDEKSLYIMISSGLIQNFDDEELSFVIGHEIGHALFDHFRYPARHLMELGADYLSPLHAMKLFAWSRNAEISADRVGLICGENFEAAARTFFKLSSGITSNAVDFHLQEYVKQFLDLKDALGSSEVEPSDWYSSHPFSPLRLKTLDIFANSETYHSLMGKSGGSISEAEMENEIKSILSLMEPEYLNTQDEHGQLIQEYIFLCGYLVTIADGAIHPSEIQSLSKLVTPAVFSALYGDVGTKDFEEIKDLIIDKCDSINSILSPIQKLNILRDLALISGSDGDVDDKEVGILYGLAEIMSIKSEFIDQTLSNLEQID